MSRYENALIQLRAHLITSPQVTRKSYRRYIEGLTLLEKYPGIQGLGYTLKISPSQLTDYERKVQKEGFPSFKVWPANAREEYFSIHFLEPFDWRNQRAFGYDMFSEVIRREAMTNARDSGEPTTTSMVKLVQETNKTPQPGFLMYVPVYNGTKKPETIEQRRQQLIGFVYAAFRSKDLLSSVFQQDPQQVKEVHVQIFDGDPLDTNLYFDNNEIFVGNNKDNDNSSLVLESFEVLGRRWTLRGQLRLKNSLQMEKALSIFLAILLGSFSFLIFWIVYSSRMHHLSGQRKELELEAAVKTRDEFMSLASHELNTPLTSLLLRTQFMERKLAKGKVEELEFTEFTTFCSNQIKRLSKLVENLLDVGRISSGKLKLQKETFNFCHMLKDVIDRTMPIFYQQESAAPHLEICEDIVGEWDLIRIEQVITNLLTNAFRYGQGKKISIFLVKIEEGLLFSIADQGPGIEESNLEKIFDRFERLANPNEISGLGLGLYLCRKIVNAHGGKIWAESQPGMGTTFFMQLPLSSPSGINVS